MFNLLTYRAYIKQAVEFLWDALPLASIPNDRVVAAINAAQLRIQEEKRLITAETRTISLTAGQQAFPLPADLLGRAVQQIAVLNGTMYATIPRVPYAQALELGIRDTTTADVPQWYTFPPDATGTILLYPPPADTTANGLLISYQAVPDPLSRVHVATTGAAVTQDSPTVATASDLTPYIQPGDAFGIRTANETPTIWYEIAAITANAITLTSNYTEATQADAPFATAQVSDLERVWPGRLQFAIAQYAASDLLASRDPEASANLLGVAMGRLGSMQHNHQPLRPYGRRQNACYGIF